MGTPALRRARARRRRLGGPRAAPGPPRAAPPGHRRDARHAAPAAPRSAERGVQGLLRRAPATCLERALVLQRWEAGQGRPGEVVIGVHGAPRDLLAHAWLDGAATRSPRITPSCCASRPRAARPATRSPGECRCGGPAGVAESRTRPGGRRPGRRRGVPASAWRRTGARRQAAEPAPAASEGGSPLAPLEVACGLVLDPRRRPAALPAAPPGDTPRAALEQAILPALRRGPCVVSFSGGRDSAAVLAVAAHVARRESLPLPSRSPTASPDAARADESWQEAIVAHLRLPDWVRLEHGDELDCIGPVARARAAAPRPAVAVQRPLPRADDRAGARRLGADRRSAATRRCRRRRGRGPGTVAPGARGPSRATRCGSATPLAPRGAAAQADRAAGRPALRLAAAGRRAASSTRAIAAEMAGEPARWRAALRLARRLARARRRHRQPRRAGRRRRRRDRAPAATTGRARRARPRCPSPTRYTTAARRPRCSPATCCPPSCSRARTRRASTRRSGPATAAPSPRAGTASGVDAGLVDPERLRAEWSTAAPDARSFTLLQAAWLAAIRRSRHQLEQQLAGGVERVPAARAPQPPRRQRRVVDEAPPAAPA